MSKTRILSKKFALMMLSCLMIVSAVMGVAFMKPVNAEANVSFDKFETTNATVSYGEAKIQTRPSDPNAGYFSDETSVNALIATMDGMGSKVSFKLPINVYEGGVQIAPIWPDEDIDNLNQAKYKAEFFITFTDVANSSKSVTIRTKRVDAFYDLAGHSGMTPSNMSSANYGFTAYELVGMQGATRVSTLNGEVVYGYYHSEGSYILKEFGVNTQGAAIVKQTDFSEGKFTSVAGHQVIADLQDASLVGNVFNGFTTGEVLVTITANNAGSLAITRMGKYDLAEADSLAYGGAGVAGEEEVEEEEDPIATVTSYDYFDVTGSGSVAYDRVKVFYGTDRPLVPFTKVDGLVATLGAEETVSFTKPVAFTTESVSSLISIAFADKYAKSSSDYNNLAFTVKVTNANNAEDYITFKSKIEWEDQYTVTVDFPGNTQVLSGKKSLWGGTLKDYAISGGKLAGYHCTYAPETGFAREALEEIANLVGAGWTQFNGATQVYVSVTAHQACSLLISTIGEYDLTDPESSAYDVKPIPQPESFDYFNVVDGSVSYTKTKIQTNNPNTNWNTYEGYYGATVKATTLVLDLNSAESKFTFGKPVDITSNNAITIAPIWKEDITGIYLEGKEIEFFITLTDAENPDNYVVIRQRLIEGTYYALAGHAGLNGALVGFVNTNSSYVSTANGEQKYGTYVSMVSQNLLKSYNVSNGQAVADHVYDADFSNFNSPTVIADLTDANYIGEAPAFEGFTSGKVYVSVSASKAHSFAITTIGEYDLTDTESPAYDALPTAEEVCNGLLTMSEGAEVRYDFDGYTGIRFTTNINSAKKADLDMLVAKGVIDSYSFGTIITPLDYLTHYSIDNPTHETLNENYYYDIASSYEGGSFFKAALVKIQAPNYDREWIGRGYVKVVIDEVETYYYADYNADNARSIYELAKAEYELYQNDGLFLFEEDVEFLETVISYVENK